MYMCTDNINNRVVIFTLSNITNGYCQWVFIYPLAAGVRTHFLVQRLGIIPTGGALTIHCYDHSLL